jgi:hypothetical protein
MTDPRVAALETKIAEAQAELQAIKAGTISPPPTPPRDEGVRILQLLDERSDLPTLDQMKKLFSVVRHRVPEQKSHDDDAPFRGFFRRVSFRFELRTRCHTERAGHARLVDGQYDWVDARA